MNSNAQHEPAPSQICLACQSPNPADQRFCGSCGSPLTITPKSISVIVEQQVERHLNGRLKDQKLAAVEIAESVYERISKWATIFIVLCTIPFAAAMYFLYGQYTNLSGLIQNTETKAKTILGRATTQAEAAERTAKEADQKTIELNKRIDERAKSFAALDSKVTTALANVDGYERRMKDYEARISRSGSNALEQVDSLKIEIATALKEIPELRSTVARQQKELTATGALVKDFASLSLVDSFKAGQKPENVLIIKHEPNKNSVYMRLARTPYPQTIRLQWDKTPQPLDSYVTLGNVVLLNWADSVDKLSQKTMFVSYVADPSIPEQKAFKVLSLKDNRVYADGKELPYIAVSGRSPQ